MLIQLHVMLTSLVYDIGDMVEDLRSREEGQGMVEYGLILALVALVAALAFTDLGKTVSSVISNVVSKLKGVTT